MVDSGSPCWYIYCIFVSGKRIRGFSEQRLNCNISLGHWLLKKGLLYIGYALLSRIFSQKVGFLKV